MNTVGRVLVAIEVAAILVAGAAGVLWLWDPSNPSYEPITLLASLAGGGAVECVRRWLPCPTEGRDRKARQIEALREIVGSLAPKVQVIMNAALSPRDITALREEMRTYHDRLDELSALFVTEPTTRTAITTLGQAGGGAVSISPSIPAALFDMYREGLDGVTAALRRLEGGK